MELSLILNLVVYLGLIGVVALLFNKLPMPPMFKEIFNIIVLFVLVIWAIYFIVGHIRH